MASETGVGSRLRTAALAGTIFTLSAVTFDVDPLQGIAFYTRYLFASLLFVTTLGQGVAARRSLSEAPRTAYALVTGAWLFLIVSAALSPFSIAPAESLAQVSILTLLVASLHIHVTRRWHHSGTVSHDTRVIFLTLAPSVVVSFAVGRFHEPRLSGLFDNPNTLATVAVMTAAIGMGLWHERKALPYLPVLAIVVVALFRTESRTAVLALGIGLAVVVLRRAGRQIPPWTAVATCFSAAAVLVFILVNERVPVPGVIARFGAENPSGPLNTRDLAWEYALGLWVREPLTGYGFRVGEVAFQQYRSQTAFTRDGAHNSYLQTLLEVGAIGFLPFLAMCITLLVVVRRLKPSGVEAGMIALIVAGLATAVTESFMFGVGQVMSWTFWLIAAAAASMAEGDTPRRTLRRTRLATQTR